jgi:hypothetical protein
MRAHSRGAAEGQVRLNIPARMDCIGLLGTAIRAVSLQAGLTLERSEQMEQHHPAWRDPSPRKCH